MAKLNPISVAVLASINGGFALLPKKMDSAAARVMVYATGYQESRFEHRYQVIDLKRPEVKGPARSFWQMERGGGCTGLITHKASRDLMRDICDLRGVRFNAAALWNAIETDDVLAAAAARLLYYTDALALPPPVDEQGGWDLYLRTWRPGAFKRQPEELRAKWVENHAYARKMVLGAAA